MIDARSNSLVLVNKKRPFKVVVCAITLVAFLFNIISYDLAWAVKTPSELTSVGSDIADIPGTFKELNPATFNLPEYLGTIKDSYFPANHKPLTANRTIIHIQDAHCNYYAQHKIAEIIEYLNKEYGVDTVNLEGGAKDYDLSIFTDIRDTNTRRKAADYFVKEGVVNGAEYFAINNPEKVALWGVEDVRLYIDNLKTYRETLKYKEDVDKYIKNLSYILSNLKRNIYSKELLELDIRYNAYKANNADFKDYLNYLIQKAKEKLIDIKSYTNIYLLSQTLGQEGDIDFRRANNGRDELIDRLQKRLSKNALEELVVKTVEFRAERLPQADFYRYLANKAKSIGVKLSDFPAFEKYMIYVSMYGAIDKSKIMEEVQELEDKLKGSLSRSDKEKELDVLSKNLVLMKNMFNISLTRVDYRYYRQKEDSFGIRNYSKFIEREAPLYNIRAKLDDYIALLDDRREEISKFYEYSFKRDNAFIKNIKLDNPGRAGLNLPYNSTKVAIIVTGGFHSENLADLFKKNNIAYVSIIPNFKNCDGYECPYFKILSGEKNMRIKDALPSVLKMALAAPTQFCRAIDDGLISAQLEVKQPVAAPSAIAPGAPSAAPAIESPTRVDELKGEVGSALRSPRQPDNAGEAGKPGLLKILSRPIFKLFSKLFLLAVLLMPLNISANVMGAERALMQPTATAVMEAGGRSVRAGYDTMQAGSNEYRVYKFDKTADDVKALTDAKKEALEKIKSRIEVASSGESKRLQELYDKLSAMSANDIEIVSAVTGNQQSLDKAFTLDRKTICIPSSQLTDTRLVAMSLVHELAHINIENPFLDDQAEEDRVLEETLSIFGPSIEVSIIQNENGKGYSINVSSLDPNLSNKAMIEAIKNAATETLKQENIDQGLSNFLENCINEEAIAEENAKLGNPGMSGVPYIIGVGAALGILIIGGFVVKVKLSKIQTPSAATSHDIPTLEDMKRLARNGSDKEFVGAIRTLITSTSGDQSLGRLLLFMEVPSIIEAWATSDPAKVKSRFIEVVKLSVELGRTSNLFDEVIKDILRQYKELARVGNVDLISISGGDVRGLTKPGKHPVTIELKSEDLNGRIGSARPLYNMLMYEENIARLLELVSIYRILYPWDTELNNSEPPLRYALSHGIYFCIDKENGIYVAPTTESFRRFLLFSMDSKGKVRECVEIKVPGQHEEKRDVAVNTYDIADALQNKYGENRVCPAPLAFLRLQKQSLNMYGMELKFNQDHPAVMVFSYSENEDGKRLDNFFKAIREGSINSPGYRTILDIMAQCLRLISIMHSLGYVLNREIGLSNFRIIKVNDKYKVIFAGDFENADRIQDIKDKQKQQELVEQETKVVITQLSDYALTLGIVDNDEEFERIIKERADSLVAAPSPAPTPGGGGAGGPSAVAAAGGGGGGGPTNPNGGIDAELELGGPDDGPPGKPDDKIDLAALKALMSAQEKRPAGLFAKMRLALNNWWNSLSTRWKIAIGAAVFIGSGTIIGLALCGVIPAIPFLAALLGGKMAVGGASVSLAGIPIFGVSGNSNSRASYDNGIADAMRILDNMSTESDLPISIDVDGANSMKYDGIADAIKNGDIIADGKDLRFTDEIRRQRLPDYWYHGTSERAIKAMLFAKSEYVRGERGALREGNLTRDKDYADSYARGEGGITLEFDFSNDRLSALEYFDTAFLNSVALRQPLPLKLLSDRCKLEILNRFKDSDSDEFGELVKVLGLTIQQVKILQQNTANKSLFAKMRLALNNWWNSLSTRWKIAIGAAVFIGSGTIIGLALCGVIPAIPFLAALLGGKMAVGGASVSLAGIPILAVPSSDRMNKFIADKAREINDKARGKIRHGILGWFNAQIQRALAVLRAKLDQSSFDDSKIALEKVRDSIEKLYERLLNSEDIRNSAEKRRKLEHLFKYVFEKLMAQETDDLRLPFTPHGAKHSYDVAEYMKELLDRIPGLRKIMQEKYGGNYEAMVVLLGLLHDIGYSKLLEAEEELGKDNVKKGYHADLGAEMVEKDLSDILRDLFGLDEAALKDFIDAILLHGADKQDVDAEGREGSGKHKYTPASKTNNPFLLLIRLADNLDISRDRLRNWQKNAWFVRMLHHIAHDSIIQSILANDKLDENEKKKQINARLEQLKELKAKMLELLQERKEVVSEIERKIKSGEMSIREACGLLLMDPLSAEDLRKVLESLKNTDDKTFEEIRIAMEDMDHESFFHFIGALAVREVRFEEDGDGNLVIVAELTNEAAKDDGLRKAAEYQVNGKGRSNDALRSLTLNGNKITIEIMYGAPKILPFGTGTIGADVLALLREAKTVSSQDMRQALAAAKAGSGMQKGVIWLLKKATLFILNKLGINVSETTYDNVIAPILEEGLFTAVPLLLFPHSLAVFAGFRAAFIILHLFAPRAPNEIGKSLITLAINRLLAPAVISGFAILFGNMPAAALIHVLINTLVPSINRTFGLNLRKGVLEKKGYNDSKVVGNDGWRPLALTVTLMRELLNMTGEEDQGYYQKLLDNETFVSEARRIFVGRRVVPARIDTYIANQSTNREQALVELIANAQDASTSEKSIGRFGVGAYQMFQDLRRPNDSIVITTSTDGATGTKVTFKLIGGVLSYKIDTIKQGAARGTKIEVLTSLEKKEAEKRVSYLKSKLKANSRGQIIVNGERMNEVENYRFINGVDRLALPDVPPVEVEVGVGGYTVIDKGSGMDPAIIFTKFLVPKGTTKALEGKKKESGGEIKEETKIFYSEVVEEDGAGTVSVQISGVINIQVPITGMHIPKEMIIELPHDAWLPESRDRVALDETTSEGLLAIMKKLTDVDRTDIKDRYCLLNGLAALLRKLLRDSPDQRLMSEFKLLCEALIRHEQKAGKTILPNRKEFKLLKLNPQEREDVIYLDEELYEFRPDRIRGAEKVKNFSSDTHTLYLADIDLTGDNDIYLEGRYSNDKGWIIVDKKKWYEEHKNNPAFLNALLNLGIGYGDKGKRLGQIRAEMPQAVDAVSQERSGASASSNADVAVLMDRLFDKSLESAASFLSYADNEFIRRKTEDAIREGVINENNIDEMKASLKNWLGSLAEFKKTVDEISPSALDDDWLKSGLLTTFVEIFRSDNKIQDFKRVGDKVYFWDNYGDKKIFEIDRNGRVVLIAADARPVFFADDDLYFFTSEGKETVRSKLIYRKDGQNVPIDGDVIILDSENNDGGLVILKRDGTATAVIEIVKNGVVTEYCRLQKGWEDSIKADVLGRVILRNGCAFIYSNYNLYKIDPAGKIVKVNFNGLGVGGKIYDIVVMPDGTSVIYYKYSMPPLGKGVIEGLVFKTLYNSINVDYITFCDPNGAEIQTENVSSLLAPPPPPGIGKKRMIWHHDGFIYYQKDSELRRMKSGSPSENILNPEDFGEGSGIYYVDDIQFTGNKMYVEAKITSDGLYRSMLVQMSLDDGSTDLFVMPYGVKTWMGRVGQSLCFVVNSDYKDNSGPAGCRVELIGADGEKRVNESFESPVDVYYSGNALYLVLKSDDKSSKITTFRIVKINENNQEETVYKVSGLNISYLSNVRSVRAKAGEFIFLNAFDDRIYDDDKLWQEITGKERSADPYHETLTYDATTGQANRHSGFAMAFEDDNNRVVAIGPNVVRFGKRDNTTVAAMPTIPMVAGRSGAMNQNLSALNGYMPIIGRWIAYLNRKEMGRLAASLHMSDEWSPSLIFLSDIPSYDKKAQTLLRQNFNDLIQNARNINELRRIFAFINYVFENVDNVNDAIRIVSRWAKIWSTNKELAELITDKMRADYEINSSWGPLHLSPLEVYFNYASQISDLPSDVQLFLSFLTKEELTAPTVIDITRPFPGRKDAREILKGELSLAHLIRLNQAFPDEISNPEVTWEQVIEGVNRVEGTILDGIRREVTGAVNGQDKTHLYWIRELVQNGRDAIRSMFGIEAKSGFIGHGFYTIFAGGCNEIRMRTGNGAETYELTLKPVYDPKGDLVDVKVVRMSKYNSSYKGTSIERINFYKGQAEDEAMIGIMYATMQAKRFLGAIPSQGEDGVAVFLNDELLNEDGKTRDEWGRIINIKNGMSSKPNRQGYYEWITGFEDPVGMDLYTILNKLLPPDISGKAAGAFMGTDVIGKQITSGFSKDKTCRVTVDNLYVDEIDGKYTALIPKEVLDILRSRGWNIEFPQGTPVPRTRNGVMASEAYAPWIMALALRTLVELFFAGELSEEESDRIGLPKDYIYSDKNALSASVEVIHDGEAINSGDLSGIDFEKYTNRHMLAQLLTIIDIEFDGQGISLNGKKGEVLKIYKNNKENPSAVSLEGLLPPGLQNKKEIAESYIRNSLAAKSVDTKLLFSEDSEPIIAAFIKFFSELGKITHTEVNQCHFTCIFNGPAQAAATGNSIVWNVAYYKNNLLPFMNFLLNGDTGEEFQKFIETYIHESGHTVEDLMRYEHKNMWSHQADQELAGSLGWIMKMLMTRLIKNTNSPDDLRNKLLAEIGYTPDQLRASYEHVVKSIEDRRPKEEPARTPSARAPPAVEVHQAAAAKPISASGPIVGAAHRDTGKREGEGLFNEIARRFKLAINRFGWKAIMDKLMARQTAGDKSNVIMALKAIQDILGLPDEDLKNWADRILLVNVREDGKLRRGGSGAELDGLIVRHNWVLKILLPRHRVEAINEKGLAGLLHEIIEIELLESGMTLETAHGLAERVQRMFEEGRRDSARDLVRKLHDRNLASEIEKSLGEAVQAALAANNIDGNDLSRLKNADLKNILRSIFSKMDEQNIYLNSKFLNIIGRFLKEDRINEFVKEFGHFNAEDLEIILERVHAFANDMHSLGVKMEVINSFTLPKLIIKPSNIQNRRMLEVVGLSGERWDKAVADKEVLKAMERGQFGTVSSRLEEIRAKEEPKRLLPASLSDEMISFLKAICLALKIEDAYSMESNFLLNLALEIMNKHRQFVENKDERLQKLLGINIRLHFIDGIREILNVCARMESRGFKIDGFMGRGFDGIVLAAVNPAGEHVVIKINIIQNGRRPEDLRATLSEIKKAVDKNRNSHFVQNLEVIDDINSVDGNKMIIEVNRLIPHEGSVNARDAIGRNDYWGMGAEESIGMLMQVLEAHKFLIQDVGAVDTDRNIGNFVIDRNGNIVDFDFGNIRILRELIEAQAEKVLQTNRSFPRITHMTRESAIAYAKQMIMEEHRECLLLLFVRILCGQHMSPTWSQLNGGDVQEFVDIFSNRFGEEYRPFGERIFKIIHEAWNDSDADLPNLISSILRELAQIRNDMTLVKLEAQPRAPPITAIVSPSMIVGAANKDTGAKPAIDLSIGEVPLEALSEPAAAAAGAVKVEPKIFTNEPQEELSALVDAGVFAFGIYIKDSEKFFNMYEQIGKGAGKLINREGAERLSEGDAQYVGIPLNEPLDKPHISVIIKNNKTGVTYVSRASIETMEDLLNTIRKAAQETKETGGLEETEVIVGGACVESGIASGGSLKEKLESTEKLLSYRDGILKCLAENGFKDIRQFFPGQTDIGVDLVFDRLSEKGKGLQIAFMMARPVDEEKFGQTIDDYLNRLQGAIEAGEAEEKVAEAVLTPEQVEIITVGLGAMGHDAPVFDIADLTSEILRKYDGMIANPAIETELREKYKAARGAVRGAYANLEEMIGEIRSKRSKPLDAKIASQSKKILIAARQKIITAQHELSIDNPKLDQDYNKLLQMLDNVIDFASGNLKMENITPEALKEVIKDAKAALNDDLKIKVSEIIWDDSLSRVPSISINRLYLKAVIFTLLKNAVHFTNNKPVEVTVGTFIKDGKNYVKIAIADHGDGIPPGSELLEGKANLWYPENGWPPMFDFGKSDTPGGTGLGLALVRNIIEIFKGSGKVEPRYIGELDEKNKPKHLADHGTTFSFLIPVVSTQPPAATPATGGEISGAAHEGEEILDEVRQVAEEMKETAKRRGDKPALAPKNLDMLVSALKGKHTAEEISDIEKILKLLENAVLDRNIVKDFRERIILMNAGKKRLASEKGRIGAAIIPHNGAYEIVFPRVSLEKLRELGLQKVTSIDQLDVEARRIIGDILHEIIEINLFGQGVQENEAHYYAQLVQNAFTIEGSASARSEWDRSLDPYRLARLERRFTVTISTVLKDMQKDAGNLDNITDAEVKSIGNKFITMTRSQGDFVSATFEKFVQNSLTRENLRNYINSENEKIRNKGKDERRLDSKDLVLMLQRLHAIACDMPKFYLTEDAVISFGNSGEIGGLLNGTGSAAPIVVPTPAIEYEILKGCGLAGTYWEGLKGKLEALRNDSNGTPRLLAKWQEAARAGHTDEAARYIEQVFSIFKSLEKTDSDGWLLNIKAVCEFFGIEPMAMARNSILNWLIKCHEQDIVIERSGASKQKVGHRVIEHFVNNGILRLLNTCGNQEVLKHTVITSFVGRGADGLALIGEDAVTGKADIIVKIITPEKPAEESVTKDELLRRSAKTEERLNKIVDATRNKSYFADNVAILRIKYQSWREDVVEIDRFVPNVTSVATLADNTRDWNSEGAEMVYIAAKIIKCTAFLLAAGATEQEGYIDNDIDNLENFLVMPDGNVRLVDFSKIYTLSDVLEMNGKLGKGPQSDEQLRMAYKKRILLTAMRVLLGAEGARRWLADEDLISNLDEYKKLFTKRYGTGQGDLARKILLPIAACFISRQNGIAAQLHDLGTLMEGECNVVIGTTGVAKDESPIKGTALAPHIITPRVPVIAGAAHEEPASPARENMKVKVDFIRELQGPDAAELAERIRAELIEMGYSKEEIGLKKDNRKDMVDELIDLPVGDVPWAYTQNDRDRDITPQRNEIRKNFKKFIEEHKNKPKEEKKVAMYFIGVGRISLEILETLKDFRQELDFAHEKAADWNISVYAIDPRLRRVARSAGEIDINLIEKKLNEGLSGELNVSVFPCIADIFDGESIKSISDYSGHPDYIFFRNVLFLTRYYERMLEGEKGQPLSALKDYLALNNMYSVSSPGTVLVTEASDEVSNPDLNSRKPAIVYPGSTPIGGPGTGLVTINDPGAMPKPEAGMPPEKTLNDFLEIIRNNAELSAVTRGGALVEVVNDKEHKYFNPAMLAVNGKIVCNYARRVPIGTDTSKPHRSDIVRLNPGTIDTELIAEKEAFIEGAEDPRIMKVGDRFGMTFTMPENDGKKWHAYFVYLNDDGNRDGEIRKLGNPRAEASKNTYLVRLENGKVAVIDRVGLSIQVYMFDSLDEAFRECSDKDSEYWKNPDHSINNSTRLEPEEGVRHVGFNVIICPLPDMGNDAYLAFTHKAKAILGDERKEYVTAVAILSYNSKTKRLEFSGNPVELPQQPDIMQEGDVKGVVYETAAGVIDKNGVSTVVSYAGINDSAIARFEMPLAKLLEIYEKGQTVTAPAAKAAAESQLEQAKGVIADLSRGTADIIIMPGSDIYLPQQTAISRSTAAKLHKDYGQETVPYSYKYSKDKWLESLQNDILPKAVSELEDRLKTDSAARQIIYVPAESVEIVKNIITNIYPKFAKLVSVVGEDDIPENGVIDDVMHIVMAKGLLNYERYRDTLSEETKIRLADFIKTLVSNPEAIDYRTNPAILDNILKGVIAIRIKPIDFRGIDEWKKAQNETLRAL